MQIPQRNRKIRWMRASGGPLEHGDVVADPVFLVLRNALGDPGDVADFLNETVSVLPIAQRAECKIFDIPALSALATRTQWRV